MPHTCSAVSFAGVRETRDVDIVRWLRSPAAAAAGDVPIIRGVPSTRSEAPPGRRAPVVLPVQDLDDHLLDA